jgi:hypothetical protein
MADRVEKSPRPISSACAADINSERVFIIIKYLNFYKPFRKELAMWKWGIKVATLY